MNKYLLPLAMTVLALIGISEAINIYHQLFPRPQIVYQHEVCDEGSGGND